MAEDKSSMQDTRISKESDLYAPGTHPVEMTELSKEIYKNGQALKELNNRFRHINDKPGDSSWKSKPRKYFAKVLSKGKDLPGIGDRLENAAEYIDAHGLDQLEKELKDYTNRVGETILKCQRVRKNNQDKRDTALALYNKALIGEASVTEMETFILESTGIKQDDELTKIKAGIIEETGDGKAIQAYIGTIGNVLKGYAAEDLLLKNTISAQSYIHTKLMEDAYGISALNPAMKEYMKAITGTSDAILREIDGMEYVSELFMQGTTHYMEILDSLDKLKGGAYNQEAVARINMSAQQLEKFMAQKQGRKQNIDVESRVVAHEL